MKYRVLLEIEFEHDKKIKNINYVCINYEDMDEFVYECVDFKILKIEEKDDERALE
jgi:hypothetical protein